MPKPFAKVVDGVVLGPGRLPKGDGPLVGPSRTPVVLTEEEELVFDKDCEGPMFSVEYVLALLKRM